MPFLQVLVAYIAQFLTVHELPAVFAGTFLFGDAIVITAFILAFRLDWNIVAVFFAAMTATLAADTLWFFVGRRVFQILGERRAKFYKKYEEKLKLVDKSIPFQRPTLVLLYFKFLQGTRIFIIVYLSMRNMRYRTFILLDAIGTVLWLLSYMALAYLIVTSVRTFLPYLDEAFFVITALFVGFVVIRIMYQLIAKKMQKKG